MEPTDAELTLRLKHHDQVAFEQLFRRHYRYIYSVAIQYVKDPALAEDALQDVFLKLWTGRETIDEGQSVRNYLAMAMRHQVLNQLRHDKRAVLRHIDHQAMRPDADTSTEDELTFNDYSTVVSHGLRLLPAQRRLVFTLRSEKGLTNEQVAAQLQLSVSTVKVHYYHACRFLREYLRDYAGIETMVLLLGIFWTQP
ncbi:RNA polymerase sigma factor [Fibrella aquatilis]|uniref:RNA polymerase sigma-70 factor n=1 Tax=Fibrella aquatilis TaxID=2817059 RepID=A0A939G7R7_9BACT|nr:RNA polymerase sigma-70 factor [Fibrella aquatilis]MBO0933987.1 RNA polymerase sigma-70 factor [Fibrella aquatilis]